MSHATVRATNIPVIVKMIAEKMNCSEMHALDLFYKSTVGECYSDDETGLYGQSPLYVFNLFLQEMQTKK